MEPLFTIITVTFNAAKTIERTLQSVDSQTFGDYEHLIVDGDSKDETISIVNKYPDERRKVRSEADHGLYDAMNKGIVASSGKYLIFLNAGDKFHSPDTLAKIAREINQSALPGIVYGQTNIVDDKGNYVGPRHLEAPEQLNLGSFADGMVVCHQAFIVLRRIVGGFNIKYKYSADYEWCIRCLQHSKTNIYIGSEPLIDYLNEGVTTSHRLPSLIERFRIMCYYYGTMGTVCRHFKFVVRWLKRKNSSRKS